MYPEKGTVSFSAGLHGWAFTLTSFAKIYAKKFGTDEVKMMEKLWGDNFFDPKTKKWTKKQTDSQSCKRGFCQFVYEPIKVIIEACMADDKKKLFTMLEKLSIADKVKTEDKEKTGKPLMKAVMQASSSTSGSMPRMSTLVLCFQRRAAFSVSAVFKARLPNMSDVTLSSSVCFGASTQQQWVTYLDCVMPVVLKAAFVRTHRLSGWMLVLVGIVVTCTDCSDCPRLKVLVYCRHGCLPQRPCWR